MGNILGIIVLVLDIFAIIDCVKSSKTTQHKVLWVVLILFLPLLGLILYYLMGRK